MTSNNDLELLFLKIKNSFGEELYIRLTEINSFDFDGCDIDIYYSKYDTGDIHIKDTDLDQDNPLGDLANRIRVAIEVENG
jgi:hypothetical protein